MSQIFQLLDKTLQKNGSELLLIADSAPTAKVGKQWNQLDPQILKSNQMRVVINESIDDEEREKLNSQGFLEGSFFLNKRRVNFTYTLTQQGHLAHFKWADDIYQTTAAWNFPTYLMDGTLKGSSLTLIAGGKNSGKTSAMAALAFEALTKKKAQVGLFADRMELAVPVSEGTFFSYQATDILKFNPNHIPCDLIAIDSNNWDVMRTGIEFCEKGYNVVMTVPRGSVKAAIERLSQIMDTAGKLGVQRISNVLNAALGVQLVAGLEQPLQAVFELLMGNSQTQGLLKEEDWIGLEEVMRTTGDKTGMRTFNQALLQMVLKRKIDLRPAFEASPRPDELDQLLKKVGF